MNEARTDAEKISKREWAESYICREAFRRLRQTAR